MFLDFYLTYKKIMTIWFMLWVKVCQNILCSLGNYIIRYKYEHAKSCLENYICHIKSYKKHMPQIDVEKLSNGAFFYSPMTIQTN